MAISHASNALVTSANSHTLIPQSLQNCNNYIAAAILFSVNKYKEYAMNATAQTQNLRFVSNLLKYTFVVVPIVAGADKFTNVLTKWEQYIDPSIASMLPLPVSTFMMVVGVIEIIAGLIVLKKAEIGGYIVAAWLTCIALSLLLGFNYVDIAVRDLVMAIAAYCMARLAAIVE